MARPEPRCYSYLGRESTIMAILFGFIESSVDLRTLEIRVAYMPRQTSVDTRIADLGKPWTVILEGGFGGVKIGFPFSKRFSKLIITRP